jgi:hypothetical protein
MTPERQLAHSFVEIVSTTDLPKPLVEIDHSDLHRLFPHGVVISYGEDPAVFTFDPQGAPEQPN